MVRHIWHGVLAAAIVLFADAPLHAATTAISQPPAEAADTSVPQGVMAQVRALTARDVARKKAETERQVRRRTVRKRRTAQTAPASTSASTGASTGATQVAAVAAPPPLPKPESIEDGTGISLSAALVEGASPLKEGIVWTIEPMGGDGTPIVTNESMPTLPLPPGRYRITAKLDDFLQSAEVDIPEEGIARLELAFNAARLRIQVLPSDDAMPLEDARIRILKIGVDGAPPVIDTTDSAFDDVLPAGIYRVEASHGLARAAQDIGLTAGADRLIQLNLAVGYVRLRARPAPDREPLSQVVFEILPADGIDNAPQPLATMSGQQAVFTLPAGTYQVLARYGEAGTTQIVDVSPNAFNDVIMDLDAGRVVVSLNGISDEDAQATALRLIRHDGNDGPGLMLTRTGDALDLGLPAGSYSMEAEAEDGRRTAADFIVEPGARVALDLTMPDVPPASVTLAASLVGGVDLPDRNVRFGKRTAGDSAAEFENGFTLDQTLSLPPGTYEIMATHVPTGAEASSTIAVESGANATARLELPLGIAELSLAPRLADDTEAEWVVTGTDGEEIVRESGDTGELVLKPGEYVVTLTVGETAYTAALSVTAGKTTNVVLPEE